MSVSILSLLLITLSTICLFDCGLLEEKKGKEIDYKVYSMVFSAKHYNPDEKKTFFFAIPNSLVTEMKIDSNNTVTLDFTRADTQKETLKVLREQGALASNSSFSEILTFTDDFKKLCLSLDFHSKQNFKIVDITDYQNITFKSFRVKIMPTSSKMMKALYITFDFAKGENDDKNILYFKNYLNEMKGNNTDNNKSLSFLE